MYQALLQKTGAGMKAIILAAGYGTRLKPLTDHVPKPLLPVVGSPLLSHVITKLKACTVTGFGINAHHKPEAMQEFVERELPGDEAVLLREAQIMGSGGGIAGFRRYLEAEEYFLLHNGDILSDVDVPSVRERFARERPLCGLVVHDCPTANNVCVAADGRVVNMRGRLKGTETGRMLAYAGIAFMRSDIFRHIPEGPSDIIDVLLQVISEGKERVQACVVEGCSWCDIGSPRHYLGAHAAIMLQKAPLVARDRMPPGPIHLGEGCSVARDVLMSGFVSSGCGVRIMPGARLENCILWDRAVVEEGRELANAVVGPGWVVQVQ